MKFTRLLALGALIALSLSGMLWWAGRADPTRPAWAAVSAQDIVSEQLVLAFYKADYNFNTWLASLPDRPEEPYTSADSLTINLHVLDALDAGIDVLVQLWHGPTTGDNPTEANFQELLSQGMQEGLEAAVAVDMRHDLLNQADEVRAALTALQETHSQHEVYLQVAGRPVVFFIAPEILSLSTWEALRADVDPQREMVWIADGEDVRLLEVFDGLYIYNIAVREGELVDDPAARLRSQGEALREWESAQGSERYWVATVMPGFDNAAIAGNPVEQPREDGAFYEETWEGALDSQAEWVIVNSYNHWLEGTQIEPSQTYDYTYIDLTADLVVDFRAAPVEDPGDEEDPTPTATSPVSPLATPTLSATVTVTATPTLTPTPEATATPEAPPTPTETPPATPTATATPFRLPTPTLLAEPTAAAATPVAGETPLPPTPTLIVVGGLPVTPTATPLPPIIVEGSTPRRCAYWPPLLLPLASVLLARQIHHRRRRLRP